jgi:hypothetical protein
MFRSLIASTNATPQVAQGYAVNNGTIRTRLSTNTAADATPQYMGHIDIPANQVSGLSTDWHARVSVIYESGTYGGVSTEASTTGNSSITRRFHVRIGVADSSDPTDLNTTVGITDPAETNSGQGGQFSTLIAAIGGSFGSEVHATQMFGTQSEYLGSGQVLNRWSDPFGSAGLRIVVSFNWESPFAANHIMKVVSMSVELIPGAATTLVTSAAPRTLNLTHFGGHWGAWPATAGAAATVPLGQMFGRVRLFADWSLIETTNWSGLTDTQRNADPGWAPIDAFVNGHAAFPARKMVVCLHDTASFYSGGNKLNPPSDLASGSASSWYRFCRQGHPVRDLERAQCHGQRLRGLHWHGGPAGRNPQPGQHRHPGCGFLGHHVHAGLQQHGAARCLGRPDLSAELPGRW